MRAITLPIILFFQYIFVFTASASGLSNPENHTSTPIKHEGLVFKPAVNATSVFNEQDAAVLRSFVEYRAKLVGCDDINVKVYANSHENPFVPVNLVDALKQKGYIVVHLDCSNENIVLQLDKIAIESENSAQRGGTFENSDTKVSESECNTCGAVMVKKELLDMFKDADYGSAPAIDFTSSFVGDGSNGGVNSNGIDINALKSKINGIGAVNEKDSKTTEP